MNLLLFLAQLQDHLTVLQSAAPFRLAPFSSTNSDFSNQCQHPMHFDRAGDTKAFFCFFWRSLWLRALVLLSTLCHISRSWGWRKHAVCGADFCERTSVQSCCLHCACTYICTHRWYARERSCYVADDTTEQLLFFCGDDDPDGSAEEASLWQHCAFCMQRIQLLGNSRCWAGVRRIKGTFLQ